ncbi:plasmid partitioning protein RepB (plasmid) [Bosea sp. F3-2]|uniref:plasmid partitioning protein RepB n=1 Tax=Bosea sp. F3-2 TaxID=2599640 RepID=UPI0011EF1AD1|nr:plasmid partitioning protein RepB [Bosea sp. F3-2]QEL26980.1 plasmid partitioning protein RepB [Bosea sp. F3-2]
MARKNLLIRAMESPVEVPDIPALPIQDARSLYANRGASRAMKQSIEEMADQAKLIADGEVVVELDPDLVDGSFVSDRIEDDEVEFALLKEGIEKEGQLQPILVRPHPEVAGRHMIVFGHRRHRAAKELGKRVRAIIRSLDDVAHIVAQGQENARRANLSFIEKARFADSLRQLGHNRQTIMAAVSVDETVVARMFSIIDVVPKDVVEALGAARAVGRPRWEELKKLIAHPTKGETASAIVRSEEFSHTPIPDRFSFLVERIKKAHKAPQQRRAAEGLWAPSDNRVAASYRNTGRTFSLSLKSKDAGEFGNFISSNLEKLYRDFRETKDRNQGD